jgi:hypothetical protein
MSAAEIADASTVRSGRQTSVFSEVRVNFELIGNCAFLAAMSPSGVSYFADS